MTGAHPEWSETETIADMDKWGMLRDDLMEPDLWLFYY